MQRPPGFKDPHRPHHVCKLNRSLYGLKQAPIAWYEELYHCLLGLCFHSSTADSSLFIKADATLTIILVYVDDILITWNSSTSCTHLINTLHSKFSMKNLGDLHYFLGIEAHRTLTSIFLSQTKYVTHSLQKQKCLMRSLVPLLPQPLSLTQPLVTLFKIPSPIVPL